MQLYINKKYDEEFAYSYIPTLIRKLFIRNCSVLRVKHLSIDLDIDVFNTISLAITTLTKSQVNDAYVLAIHKNIKIEDKSLTELINTITYGTRSMKGYPILLEIFNYISDNIELLYKG